MELLRVHMKLPREGKKIKVKTSSIRPLKN